MIEICWYSNDTFWEIQYLMPTSCSKHILYVSSLLLDLFFIWVRMRNKGTTETPSQRDRIPWNWKWSIYDTRQTYSMSFSRHKSWIRSTHAKTIFSVLGVQTRWNSCFGKSSCIKFRRLGLFSLSMSLEQPTKLNWHVTCWWSNHKPSLRRYIHHHYITPTRLLAKTQKKKQRFFRHQLLWKTCSF